MAAMASALGWGQAASLYRTAYPMLAVVLMVFVMGLLGNYTVFHLTALSPLQGFFTPNPNK